MPDHAQTRGTPLNVDVRELMAAIHDALNVPHTLSRTPEARMERLQLIEARVDSLVGILRSFSGPSDRTALDVADAVRRIPQARPTSYETWRV